ncbi:MAG: hypothetical protein RH980_00910 [Roseovarius confluentis]|tara:strand:+ start:477 stop:1070 length:594 start_codon:yes stop_codon:yes gene_type:complete
MNPLDLPANEFGDFLAGILGPLGILWIVLGFWQQGDELRSSVDALNLQSEELKHSVEQQKALVEFTREQATAELQALNDERTARRLAALPKLKLMSGGGTITGGQVHTSFRLRNIGADYLDVELRVLGEHPTKLRSLPTLSCGEEQMIPFVHPKDRHLECIVEIAFRTGDGETGSVNYRATRANAQSIGFNLEQISL